ncbi:MAG: Glutamate dehydrogenase, partial [Blastococcus sp.]|nr:Glutamate dehydrogenase [Blastococcus sp.]
MASTTGTVPETPVRTPDSGRAAGASTELAALEAARDEKRRLLDRAAEAALSGGGPERALPAGCTPEQLPALLQRYYWSEPAAEVLGHAPAELAELALGHLRLAEVRPPGSATVDAQHLPDGRAVIRLVTDDMPYLVDSVTAEVIRQGFALAHIVHPVVVVRRDLRGQISAFCDSALADGCGPDALTESWMAVVLDGPLDEEASTDLVSGLRTVLDDVRAVDEDSDRLRSRVLELAGRLDELAAGGYADPADDPAEAAALLRWLADGNFVFLGARDVEQGGGHGEPVAAVLPGTGLGVLRSDADMSESTSRLPEAVRTPEQHLLTVTKADTRSPVYRRSWLDLIAVGLPTDQQGRARQHRFVGLFPSAAYTSSVLDVPLVRRRVAEVIDRSGVPADSHTGKELLDVLETYPRDELLQVGADELLPVALAVQHLQERRQTRLFLRQDATGRFWSALVYLPRDRYTTEVRTRMQRLLLERLGGTSVEYTARSTESVLARLHFVVRVPVGRRGTPPSMAVDVEALQEELAAAARSWTDGLTEALHARYGADAERLLSRVADAFPAAYQENFSAEQAVDDLARLDGLSAGQLSLRLWTPPGSAAGERRLTVYRVGERLLLSEVLPVLQNMGVSVVDERPYEIERIGAPPTWIYDFGVAVP